MKVLITLLGRSGWGLFNSVWAMIRTHDYVPEKVYLLTDGCQMPMAEQVRTMLAVLLGEYEENHEIEIVPLKGGPDQGGGGEGTGDRREGEEAGEHTGPGRDPGNEFPGHGGGDPRE